ncbi:MAG: MFS transporter [Pseudomonadota bacterium]
MDFRALALLILGHLVTDTTQGGLPILLPMLQENLGLTYAASGAIMMTMQLTSSVIQPLFGFLTDRYSLRWLLPAGVAISGLGFACLGLAHTYGLVLVLVVVTGLGVASFHPEAFKAVLGSAGDRKVVAVSWFMVGGNAGMGLGPLLLGMYLALWGPKGTLAYAVPGLIVAGLFMATWSRLHPTPLKETAKPAVKPAAPLSARAYALTMLILAVILRAWVHSGVITFVPFWYIHVRGGSPAEVAPLVTTFLVAGVVGTVAGGHLAERVGTRRFFVVSVALVTPALFWLLHSQGWWLYGAMAVSGCLLISTWSTIMVMAQQILPDRAGMASGLMVGLAMGTGGVGATVLGGVADNWGVEASLLVVSVMPVLSAVVAMFIPLDQVEPARAPARA